MDTQQSTLHRLKNFYISNPSMVWAIGWVTVAPSLGSLTAINLLYSHRDFLAQTNFLSWAIAPAYLLVITVCMGLALLPTTFVAILSGFLLGWTSLPFLVLGYTLATLIGYQTGQKVDKDSLDFLLKQYPKAADLIVEKKEDMSQLIFFVRLSPVIPFALSNLLFALLKVDLKKVVWIGLWGMLPRTLMVFITGVLGDSLFDALQDSNGAEQMIFIGILLLVSVAGIYMFFKKKRKDNR